jgi:hypothetical protein
MYRLTFMLPASLVLVAPPGRHQPCIHGCVLHVRRAGLVEIEGPSRDALFEQARRFLRIIARGRPPMQIAAHVASPPALVQAARDAWWITINSDVTFSPGGIDPVIAPAPADATNILLAG